MQYRNVSGHPEDLENGRVVGVGEVFELDAETAAVTFNKNKIESGAFIAAPDQQDEEPVTKKRKQLLEKATALDIGAADELNDNDLATAIAEAEKNKEAQS